MKVSDKFLQKVGFPYILEHLPVQSPMGEICKRNLKPYAPAEKERLLEELALVTWALERLDTPAWNKLLQELMLLKDVSGSLKRLESGELTLPELFELKGFALRLRGTALALESLAPVPEALCIDACPEVLDILDPEHTLTPAFALREGWSEELSQIRSEKRSLEKQIAAAHGEQREKLLVARTAVCAREEAEEQHMRRAITAELAPFRTRLEEQAGRLGHLDLVGGKAALARELGGVCPRFTEKGIGFTAMRIPQLEARLKESGRSFTPLTIELSKGICALTGANMGGKSVALCALGLNVYLAHCGCYVFAEEGHMPLLDGLCLVDGEMEDAQRGLSSFGGELMAAEEAALEAEKGLCLCLFDEFARGTNPFEGARIQKGTARYFRSLGAYSVFVTHYDGVSALADVCYCTRGLKNMPDRAMPEAHKDRLALLKRYMDYGLEPVPKNAPVPREALRVAELMGLEPTLLQEIRQAYEE